MFIAKESSILFFRQTDRVNQKHFNPYTHTLLRFHYNYLLMKGNLQDGFYAYCVVYKTKIYILVFPQKKTGIKLGCFSEALTIHFAECLSPFMSMLQNSAEYCIQRKNDNLFKSCPSVFPYPLSCSAHSKWFVCSLCFAYMDQI